MSVELICGFVDRRRGMCTRHGFFVFVGVFNEINYVFPAFYLTTASETEGYDDFKYVYYLIIFVSGYSLSEKRTR